VTFARNQRAHTSAKSERNQYTRNKLLHYYYYLAMEVYNKKPKLTWKMCVAAVSVDEVRRLLSSTHFISTLTLSRWSIPQRGAYVPRHVTHKFSEISNNVLTTVRDRHIVTINSRKSHMAYRIVLISMTLSDAEGHFSCLKAL